MNGYRVKETCTARGQIQVLTMSLAAMLSVSEVPGSKKTLQLNPLSAFKFDRLQNKLAHQARSLSMVLLSNWSLINY
jgi:hypothetical protein